MYVTGYRVEYLLSLIQYLDIAGLATKAFLCKRHHDNKITTIKYIILQLLKVKNDTCPEVSGAFFFSIFSRCFKVLCFYPTVRLRVS